MSNAIAVPGTGQFKCPAYNVGPNEAMLAVKEYTMEYQKKQKKLPAVQWPWRASKSPWAPSAQRQTHLLADPGSQKVQRESENLHFQTSVTRYN